MDNNYEELIDEYREQRIALKSMVADLENLKIGVEKLFPERLDARNIKFLEEKVKAITDLFKAILDIRKELSKSVKDEIELRRKLNEKEEDGDNMENIAELAKKVEALTKAA